MTAPAAVAAELRACWYSEDHRRPAISRCPRACNGLSSHAERQGDGAQRFYCGDHAFWRATEVGKAHVRPLREGELA